MLNTLAQECYNSNAPDEKSQYFLSTPRRPPCQKPEIYVPSQKMLTSAQEIVVATWHLERKR
jgi:hypothetical protein